MQFAGSLPNRTFVALKTISHNQSTIFLSHRKEKDMNGIIGVTVLTYIVSITLNNIMKIEYGGSFKRLKTIAKAIRN